jgi:hypothetical protein
MRSVGQPGTSSVPSRTSAPAHVWSDPLTAEMTTGSEASAASLASSGKRASRKAVAEARAREPSVSAVDEGEPSALAALRINDAPGGVDSGVSGPRLRSSEGRSRIAETGEVEVVGGERSGVGIEIG